ncbi:MAG: RNA-directed DNA polymerase [Streptococcaceae bacterium]|jgi:retron-type reverse transcriptase|nr:RNA-directed DNA polymerase [Streptococcaceae bacterium]
MTHFEKLISLEHLYQAHLKAKSGHRHKGEVIRYEVRLMENLIRLREKLLKNQIKTIHYYHFTIYDPKVREIYATNYETRILLHCLCDNYLIPLLSKRLIYDNAACQKGKGTHFALKRFSYFINQYFKRNGYNGYILKCDISKYFDSINHQILKEKLSQVVKEHQVRLLLEMIIDSYHTPDKAGCGLPLGNQTSQWFALFYLDRVDRLIKEQYQIKFYIRYMDDFVMIHQDKQVLSKMWQSIELELEKEQLTLNSKTQITKLTQGVTFLGFRFILKPSGKIIKRMRGQSKIRMNQRVKRVCQDFEQGIISFEQFQSTMMSYKGHLKHGTANRLVQKIQQIYHLHLF